MTAAVKSLAICMVEWAYRLGQFLYLPIAFAIIVSEVSTKKTKAMQVLSLHGDFNFTILLYISDLCYPAFKVFYGKGTVEVISLYQIAVRFLNKLKLVFGFHAFCHAYKPQTFDQRDNMP